QESGMYQAVSEHGHIRRGSFLMLFTSRERALRYLSCIAIAIPVWFIVGILMIFSPELGRELGLTGEIRAPMTSLCWSAGIAAGDLVSGVLSQLFRTRKKIIITFVLASAALAATLLHIRGASPAVFYTL